MREQRRRPSLPGPLPTTATAKAPTAAIFSQFGVFKIL